jgi:hypothetical protein
VGHDSERAATIHPHSSRERQRALADAVGEAARAELAKPKGGVCNAFEAEPRLERRTYRLGEGR